MARASRRGDTANWMRSRRKEYERIDTACKAAWERKKMDDMKICRAVADCLNGSFSKDKHAVRDTATNGKDQVFVTLLRPEGGAYYLTLTIKEDYENE